MPATFKRTFSVPLDETALAVKAKEMASITADIDRVEDEKKSFAAACKDKLDVLYGKLSETARIVRSGEEEKRVDCQWVPHPDRPMMQLHRLDRAEIDPERIVEERAMTDEEKQAKLDDKWDSFAEKLNEPAEADEAAEAPAKKPAAQPSCPALIGEPGEIYNVCGKPGAKRVGGYCEDHKGRMKQGDVRARDVTARKKRDDNVAALRKEQGGDSEPGAAPDATDSVNIHDFANDISRCIDCGEAPCMCEERAGDAA